jgi:RNA polymerase sigma-70 factor (ECF subfamily)
MILNLDLKEKVQSALNSLSGLERSAFTLRHFEGMSIEEISAALGLHTNAAKHSIFRAVRKMRRALAPTLSLEA